MTYANSSGNFYVVTYVQKYSILVVLDYRKSQRETTNATNAKVRDTQDRSLRKLWISVKSDRMYINLNTHQPITIFFDADLIIDTKILIINV